MPAGAKTVGLKRATTIASGLIAKMKEKRFVTRAKIAGKIRRKEAPVGDIDILVVVRAGKEDAFYDWMIRTLRPLSGGPQRYAGKYGGLPIHILLTEPKSWGAALMYLTGPKGFNISRRRVAKDRGYLLNQHGLYGRKSGRYLAGRTESEIFDRLKITARRPEDR